MFKDEPITPVHSRNGFSGILKMLAMLLVLTVACLASATALGVLPFDQMADTVVRIGLIIGFLGSAAAIGWLMMGQRGA